MTLLKLISVAAILVVLILAGCTASDPLLDNALCKQGQRNISNAADGQSSPIAVKLADGQKLVITYVARFTSGSAEWWVRNDQGHVIWRQALQPATQTTTISPSPDLQAGSYTVVQMSNSLKQPAICWWVLAQ